MTVNEKTFFRKRQFFTEIKCFLKKILAKSINRYVHFEAADINELRRISQNDVKIVYIAHKSSVIEQFIFNVFLILKDLRLPYYSFGPALLWNYRFFRPLRRMTEFFCGKESPLIRKDGFYVTFTKKRNEFRFGWASYFTRFSGEKAVVVPVIALWNKDVKSSENKKWHWLFPFVGRYNIWTTGWQFFLFIIRRRKLTLRLGLHSEINFSEFSSENESNLYTIVNHETKKVVGRVLRNWYDIRNETLMELLDKKSSDEKDILRYTDKISMRYSPHFTDTLHRLTGKFIKRIASIDIPDNELDNLRKTVSSRRNTFVFVPTHKSYMDHIFLFNLLYVKQVTVPLVISGDNLDFFPLGKILKKTGAIFIKRKTRHLYLYNDVFKTYLKHIVKTGYNLEFFPEGGRSRFGKVRSIRGGVLKMLAEIKKELMQEILIIPVSITYENLPDIMSYKKELISGKEKENINFSTKIKAFFKFDYGRTYINFGKPIDLPDNIDESFLREIGHLLEHNSVIPVSAIISTCLLSLGKISMQDLYKKAFYLAKTVAHLEWIKISSELENFSFFKKTMEEYVNKEMIYNRDGIYCINYQFMEYFIYYTNLMSAAFAPFFLNSIEKESFYSSIEAYILYTIKGFSVEDIEKTAKIQTRKWFQKIGNFLFINSLKELLWVINAFIYCEESLSSSEKMLDYLKKSSLSANLSINIDSLNENIFFLKHKKIIDNENITDRIMLARLKEDIESALDKITVKTI